MASDEPSAGERENSNSLVLSGVLSCSIARGSNWAYWWFSATGTCVSDVDVWSMEPEIGVGSDSDPNLLANRLCHLFPQISESPQTTRFSIGPQKPPTNRADVNWSLADEPIPWRNQLLAAALLLIPRLPAEV